MGEQARITVDVCRKAGFCASAIRSKCAELGLDLRTFVESGTPVDLWRTLAETDAHVKILIDLAERSDSGA